MSTPEARMKLGESAQALRKTGDPMDASKADMLEQYSHLRASTSEVREPDWRLTVGGKPLDDLQKELQAPPFKVDLYAMDMLNSPDFTTSEKPEEVELIRRSPKYLGFTKPATLEQILTRGDELGYDKCTAEVAAYLRLADEDQPLGDFYYMAMDPITDRDGYPYVFLLERDGGGAWLHGHWADPGHWDPGSEFMFGLRK